MAATPLVATMPEPCEPLSLPQEEAAPAPGLATSVCDHSEAFSILAGDVAERLASANALLNQPNPQVNQVSY